MQALYLAFAYLFNNFETLTIRQLKHLRKVHFRAESLNLFRANPKPLYTRSYYRIKPLLVELGTMQRASNKSAPDCALQPSYPRWICEKSFAVNTGYRPLLLKENEHVLRRERERERVLPSLGRLTAAKTTILHIRPPPPLALLAGMSAAGG